MKKLAALLVAWVVATLRLPRRGSVGWLAATAGGVLAAGEDWLALVGDATLLGSITVGLCTDNSHAELLPRG